MKKSKSSDYLRPYSSIVLDGDERAAARSMLYPVGFKPEDFKKPLIGIASTWSKVTPCNMHIDKLAREAEKGANEAGGKAIIFNTITVSDGISMGTRRHEIFARLARGHRRFHRNRRGLRGHGRLRGHRRLRQKHARLAHRHGAAEPPRGVRLWRHDSARLHHRRQRASSTSCPCSKPSARMRTSKIADAELQAVEQCAIPGPGSCGGMYTANTMASAIEALGMSLPNSSAQNAISPGEDGRLPPRRRVRASTCSRAASARSTS